MATIRDNRDGTISTIEDDGTERKFEKGSGDQVEGPAGEEFTVGTRGGRGDLPRLEGTRGGTRDDTSRTPQVPVSDPIQETDAGEVRRLQEEYAVLVNEGREDEGFINVRLALRRAGLTQLQANEALLQVSNNPSAFSRTTPPGDVPDQGRTPQEQQAIMEQVRGAQLTEQGLGGAIPLGGGDATTGAAPPGALSGTDIAFGEGSLEDMFLSAPRETRLSTTPGGRSQLFNELVANVTQGAGGAAPFIQNFANTLGGPLESLFRFGQVPGVQAGFDPSTFPSFSEFASGIGPSLGNLGGLFQTTIQDVLGRSAALQGDPTGIGGNAISDFFAQNPGAAFNLGLGAQNVNPFSPFANAFQTNARRNFNVGLSQGGDPFDFLRGVSGGQFGGFFG